MYCGQGILCDSPSCALGSMCLMINNCVNLDYSEAYNLLGRSLTQSICLPYDTPGAFICSSNSCRLEDKCFPLTEYLYVG